MLDNIGYNPQQPTITWVDNKSAIAKNPIYYRRTKHIKIKYQTIRDDEKTSEIYLKYCCTQEQLVDILTKALSRPKFKELRDKLGISKNLLKKKC